MEHLLQARCSQTGWVVIGPDTCSSHRPEPTPGCPCAERTCS